MVVDCFVVLQAWLQGLCAVGVLAIIKKAQELSEMVGCQFGSYIGSRVTNLKKRHHWCLEWTEMDLLRVSAIMAVMGHILDDLPCAGIKWCLLANPLAEPVFADAGLGNLDDCYVYF